MCYFDAVRRSRIAYVNLILVLLLASPLAAEEAEVWYKVSMSGVAVGVAKDRRVDDERGQLYEQHMDISVSRMGTSISMVLRMEELDDDKGRLVRFRSETNMNGAKMIIRGERKGKYVYIEEESAGYVQKRTIKWESGAVGLVEVDRLVQNALENDEETLSVRVFDTQSATFQDMRFVVVGRVPHVGVEHVLVEQYIDDGQLPAATSWYRPGDWEATRVEINQLGIQIAIDRIDADEVATLELDPNFDMILQSMIAVEGYPGRPDDVADVTFRLTFSGPPVTEASLAGPNQRVARYEGQAIDLVVSRETVPTGQLENAEPFLASDRHIQSDHPRVRAMADSIASASGLTGAELARELQLFVNDYISEKSMGFGFASALDVMNTRAGDCTEHSVLLTSLMRAAGIPSRVAVGVAYGEGFLIGHMWSEAYIDGWRTYDALDLNNNPIRIRISGSTNERAIDETDLVDAYGLLGGLTVEVIDFRLIGSSP